jgi:3-deoxy-7-phosphoheptulonate synthase
MKPGATEAQIAKVSDRIKEWGFAVHLSEGAEHTIIGIIGDGRPVDRDQLDLMEGVDRTAPIQRPFKLAGRDFHPQDTVFPIDGVSIGGSQLIMMAGPCAVENHDQLMATAEAVKAAGAHVLRGGAFKPRSSPYSFQGLGEEGLRLLALAREKTGMPIVTEVVSPEQVPLVAAYADILQIGRANMQNYALRTRRGAQRPVLLKRG